MSIYLFTLQYRSSYTLYYVEHYLSSNMLNTDNSLFLSLTIFPSHSPLFFVSFLSFILIFFLYLSSYHTALCHIPYSNTHSSSISRFYFLGSTGSRPSHNFGRAFRHGKRKYPWTRCSYWKIQKSMTLIKMHFPSVLFIYPSFFPSLPFSLPFFHSLYILSSCLCVPPLTWFFTTVKSVK